MKTLWKRVKRILLFCSALLFCGFLYAAYSELAPALDSRAGKAVSWSAGVVLSPFVSGLPWWFWGGVVGVAGYLWMKHKLVMSIVYGSLVGAWLAFL